MMALEFAKPSGIPSEKLIYIIGDKMDMHKDKNIKHEDIHDFDQLVKEYNQNMAKQLGKDNAKYAEYKLELLSMLIPKKAGYKILNFGCGVGRDMDFFGKYFGNDIDLYGCDISQKSIEYAASITEGYKYFQSEETEALYHQNVKFDVVFIAGVLHHMDPEERSVWMQAIADNVAAGGYMCVFEHNPINPKTKHIITHPIEYPPQDKLEWMLKLNDIKKLLVSANPGMREYWKGYTLFSPFRRPWITSIEKYLGWCPLGAQQCVIVKKDSNK